MLRFEQVSLRYGDEGPDVLSGMSFALEPGSFHFLTGPSGAGKSSLMKMAWLAERPTGGRIVLFGQDTATIRRASLPALRRRIGVVFQDFRLLPHLSALDNVALPLRLAGGVGDATVREHVAELLHWVGLGDKLKALPASLSGGEQQRVAIARAVINRPKLLLADEPTGNVDDEIGLRLLHLFLELNKLGTTVLIATHNQNLMKRINKPRWHIQDGKLTPNKNTQRGVA